jgi:hypothetical protein
LYAKWQNACVKFKRENKVHVEKIGQVFGANSSGTSANTRFV